MISFLLKFWSFFHHCIMLIMLILLLKTIFALRLTNKAKINSMQKQPHKNGGETYHIKLYNKSEETRLGQLGANISPDRSSLTPQVLIGNFLKHNYPLLYELQHINLLCLYLPKEDGVSPDAEYITQIIFSIFLQW